MTDALEIAAIRGSLAAVAGALSQQLQPQLPPDAARSARECAAILLRLAGRLADAPVGDTPAAEAAVRDAEETALAEREAGLADNAAPQGQRAFDVAEFEQYLRSRERESPALRIAQAQPLVGGRSKRTILLTLDGSATLPSQIVLRQDWAAAITGTSVVSEFAVLQALWQAGIKVPQPLFLEPSADVLGGPFVAVQRLPGRGHGDIFHPLHSPRMVEQLATELARLHACAVEPFERSGVTTDAYTPVQLGAGLERFRATHAQIGVASPAIDSALHWMARNVDRVDGPRALLHNDIGCHNLLIDGEELVAILDWELGQIGNPAADLGYIRGWVSQVVPWDRFMAVYHDAGGPPVTPRTLDFYTLWCGVRLYCLLLQARAGIAKGVVCDTEIAYAYAQFLPLLLRRIAHELIAALDRDGAG